MVGVILQAKETLPCIICGYMRRFIGERDLLPPPIYLRLEGGDLVAKANFSSQYFRLDGGVLEALGTSPSVYLRSERAF